MTSSATIKSPLLFFGAVILASVVHISCGDENSEKQAVGDEKTHQMNVDAAIQELNLQAQLIPRFGTEEDWQASMARLRQNTAAIEILATVIDKTASAELSELSRKDAVFIMGHMKDVRAIPHLVRVAVQPFSKEEKSRTEEMDQAFQLRLSAIYGLERMGAKNALLEMRDLVDTSLKGFVDSALARLGHPMPTPRPLSEDILNFKMPENFMALRQESRLKPSLEDVSKNVLAQGDAPVAPIVTQSNIEDTQSFYPTRSSATAGACGVSDPHEEPLFEYEFWCSQNWINYFWPGYSFSKEHWDNGMGYEAPCNYHLPLGRTFNTIQVLNYSMNAQIAPSGFPATIFEYADHLFYYGGQYTMENIEKLTASCATDSTATTYDGVFVEDRTVLKKSFFYNSNVLRRAAVLMHEARHATGCGHNGNDGSNECISGSDSCDESFSNGCDFIGSAQEPGAVTYHVLWLWGFLRNATPYYNTTAMRAQAINEANTKLKRYFDELPCFIINEAGELTQFQDPACL